MKERLLQELEQIKEAGNYREIRYVKPVNASRLIYEGREYLNLCSNSYLSLHLHPDVMRAAKDAIDEYGAGTCSSRSVSGSIDLYARLEDEVASFKGYEKALIFSNGYLANIGIIATLAGAHDVIFSDELNHSSIIDSTRLSRARRVIYRHLDIEDLEKKIRRESVRTRKSKKFIITETVFSMDGDVAPLREIFNLKEKYGLHVIVDEAHATGVFGEGGRGVEELHGLSGLMDVQMGTFGKALGSFGAFALADSLTIDYLINRARTFMYTTALPASALAAARSALQLIRDNGSFKKELWENLDYMRRGLLHLGFDLKQSEGPIVPIVVGEDSKAVRMQKMLLEKGIFLQAIRPPTVPSGTSRLRLTVVRGLTKEEMDKALEAIGAAGKEVGLI
ncbi:MAG TPA: 8-amino-7-oxononanoate synthase [Syntrophorhabdales bacterium]|nr:8-amino-7-oxononanoate synthase [Syntrophorhabdales bacterium]